MIITIRQSIFRGLLSLCCIILGFTSTSVLAAAPSVQVNLSVDRTLQYILDIQTRLGLQKGKPLTYRFRSDVVSPVYKVGDKTLFWVKGTEGDDIQVNTSLTAVGQYCYVYQVDGGSMPDGIAALVSTQFDTVVYPGVRRYFGSEPTPGVDGDRRITILLVDEPGLVAGYFDPRNLYKMDKSNVREMLVLNVNHLKASQADLNTGLKSLYSTMAHEFQHLVHYGADPDEELWLTEGLSQYAEYLLYGDTSRLNAFKNQPTTSLTEWGWSLESYGAALSFVLYLAEHYSVSGNLSKLVANEQNGIDGIQSYLKSEAYSVNFETIFDDWTIANIVDDESIGNGRYFYKEIDMKVKSSQIDDLSQDGSIFIPPWAGVYLVKKGGSEKELKLDLRVSEGVESLTITSIYKDTNGHIIVERLQGRLDKSSMWVVPTPKTSSDVIFVVSTRGRAEPGFAYRFSREVPNYGKIGAVTITALGIVATVLQRGGQA